MRFAQSMLRRKTRSVAAAAAIDLSDWFLFGDATAAGFTISLPALATVPSGRTFTVQKTDITSNTIVLDPNGAETINGSSTFTLYGSGDTVEVTALPTGWRITNYLGGEFLVQSDALETSVLAAAPFAATSGAVGAQTAAIYVVGRTGLDIVVEITALGASLTEISVAGRASGLSAPVVGTPAQWNAVRADNLTASTGVSATQPYVTTIPVTAIGRFLIRLPVSQTWMSALVWVSAGTGVGSTGNVYFQRRVGN